MDIYKNPCCGFSLYRGTKVIAVIDLATSIFSAVLFGFGLLIAIFRGNAVLNDINGSATSTDDATETGYIGVGSLIFIFFVISFVHIFYIFLARFLLHAAQARNEGKLQKWLDITAVVLGVRLLGYFVLLLAEGAVFLIGIVWCIYSAYSLWVVHSFKKQLLVEGESSLLRDAVYYSRLQKI